MSREATSLIQGLQEAGRMIEFLLFVSIGGLVYCRLGAVGPALPRLSRNQLTSDGGWRTSAFATSLTT
jgi:hypothetical protein